MSKNIRIDPSVLNPAQMSKILMDSGMSPSQVSGMSSEQLFQELSKTNQGSSGPWTKLKGWFGKSKSGATGAGAGASTAGASTAGSAAGTAGAAGKGGLFANGLKSKFKSGASALLNPEFDYNLKSGVQGWGKNLGGYLNLANLAMQVINTAQGLDSLSDAQSESDDLVADIVASAMNNPMVNYDLTADQRKLLSQLRRGTYSSDIGLDDVNLLGALGDAGMGVLTGVSGGIPGMVIGGVGGLLNSGIGDLGNAQARQNAELEALYAALQESNQNYNNMRKQRMMASF